MARLGTGSLPTHDCGGRKGVDMAPCPARPGPALLPTRTVAPTQGFPLRARCRAHPRERRTMPSVRIPPRFKNHWKDEADPLCVCVCMSLSTTVIYMFMLNVEIELYNWLRWMEVQ